jgi:hypothetical protein
MKQCLVCGEIIKPKSSQVLAALWHFRPLYLSQRSWFWGTLKKFGLLTAVCLMSPLVNILWNWKYRRSRLTSQFLAIDDLPT